MNVASWTDCTVVGLVDDDRPLTYFPFDGFSLKRSFHPTMDYSQHSISSRNWIRGGILLIVKRS
eukprot:scaffold15892_cov58-Cyclotella_meneghiniana.AAC.3